MGQEAVCRVRYRSQVSLGTALLESHELSFRGDFRLKIPLAAIESVKAADGKLRIRSAAGVATFELGRRSATWLNKILNPPSRLDKLGVKPTSAVGMVCIRDGVFADEVVARAASVWQMRPKKNSDIIFMAAEALFALKQLPRLQKFIKPDGAIWVIYPRGQHHITEAEVLAAGRNSGLVDVKVARFSETHTALKFVRPAENRT